MAFDKHRDHEKLEEEWEEIRKMDKRHAQASQVIQQTLLAPATAILSVMRDRPQVFREYFEQNGIIDFDRLERVMAIVMASARILPAMFGSEREARGLPAEVVGEDADVRYGANQIFGDDDTRQLAQELFARINNQEAPKAIVGIGPPPPGEDAG